MKPKSLILGMLVGAMAMIALAQQAPTTQNGADISATQQESRMVTVTGTVIQYEPGKTIVIRHPDNQVLTYILSPSLAPPSDMTIGRTVSIVTEPSGSGAVVVTKIETTSLTPEGDLKTTTEQREVSASGEETKTETTAVYGTVSALEPGKSITIVQPNKTTVTYVINAESEIPVGLTTGRTVTVETTTVTGASSPVVRRVIYKKVTKKTVKP
jgi:hypothetical protein